MFIDIEPASGLSAAVFRTLSMNGQWSSPLLDEVDRHFYFHSFSTRVQQACEQQNLNLPSRNPLLKHHPRRGSKIIKAAKYCTIEKERKRTEMFVCLFAICESLESNNCSSFRCSRCITFQLQMLCISVQFLARFLIERICGSKLSTWIFILRSRLKFRWK